MATTEKKRVKVEAKAKVALRHKRAIAKFEKWLAENPKAQHTLKMETFDELVDES
jgi:hypothetical protein